MDELLLILKYGLPLDGAAGCLLGIVYAAGSDGYTLAVYLGWLAIEVVLFSTVKYKEIKWILAFIVSTAVISKTFSIWAPYVSDFWDSDFEMVFIISMEYYAPLFTLNSILGWISKKREEEKSLIRYKNNKSLLRAVEMGIEEKQKLLNQQSRAIEIIALLNACGSNTVSIQENQNYKRAEDIKAQLAELEVKRAKIEFSIEAYEENRAK